MIFKNRVNLFVICARVDNFEAFVINRTKYHDFLTFFNNGFLAPEYILITIKKILRGPYPLSTLTLLLRVKQEICKDTKSQTAAVWTSRTYEPQWCADRMLHMAASCRPAIMPSSLLVQFEHSAARFDEVVTCYKQNGFLALHTKWVITAR